MGEFTVQGELSCLPYHHHVGVAVDVRAGQVHRRRLTVNTGMTQGAECKVSQEDLDKHQIELPLRDACAHLLIPLNTCRRATFYLPWKCEDERHGYEACQYLEYRKRVALKAERGKE